MTSILTESNPKLRCFVSRPQFSLLPLLFDVTPHLHFFFVFESLSHRLPWTPAALRSSLPNVTLLFSGIVQKLVVNFHAKSRGKITCNCDLRKSSFSPNWTFALIPSYTIYPFSNSTLLLGRYVLLAYPPKKSPTALKTTFPLTQ